MSKKSYKVREPRHWRDEVVQILQRASYPIPQTILQQITGCPKSKLKKFSREGILLQVYARNPRDNSLMVGYALP